MPHSGATAAEIDSKLRDDFRRRLKEYGYQADLTDPILSLLFRTFAQQLEALYDETDRIRLALLDELIANLGLEPRAARPAQTVVRFAGGVAAAVLPVGTELVAEALSGERLTFATDQTVAVSGARLAAAFAYQDGALQLLAGVDMADAVRDARPSLDAVRVELGPNPALFLAIENLPATHLDRHGVFIEVAPSASRLRQALETETWCLVQPDGTLSGAGLLRPATSNAGVQVLEWLTEGAAESDAEGQEFARLPKGFYGGRVFVLPQIPASRRFTCIAPRGMDAALRRIFGREAGTLLAEPRAWLRISMPADVPPLRTAVEGVLLHTVTASNVERLNQTIQFAQHGTSIPVVRDAGGVASHLVAPLSVVGEQGVPYLPETQPTTDGRRGRYAVRTGRIELRPALWPDGRAETQATVRLWVTSGTIGNTVMPGRVNGFLRSGAPSGLRVTNTVAAAGGTSVEPFGDARLRLASVLLSRDRVVTRDDLTHVSRAFDTRIRRADATAGVVSTPTGLQRAEHVRVYVREGDFVDPVAEIAVLKTDLQARLVDRFPSGTALTVDVVFQ